jgi:hypothetical protein
LGSAFRRALDIAVAAASSYPNFHTDCSIAF